MKRFSILIACMALCFGFSAVSAWAIWEGNAGIAAASEFPGKGLYARSDMFPKNTVVIIENLETGIKARAVVTGPSGVSGLVALLSPETASALNVRSGSVSRVRISIPAVVSEKGATGISEGESSATVADPDVNPAVAAGAAGAGAIPLESIAGESENPLVPLESSSGDAALAESVPDTGTSGDTAAAPESYVEPGAGESALADNDGGAETGEAENALVAPPAVVAGTAADETEAPAASPGEAVSGRAFAEGEYAAPEALASESPQSYYEEPELAAGDSSVSPEETLPVEEDSVALVPTEMNPPAGKIDPDSSMGVAAPLAPVGQVETAAAPTTDYAAALPIVGSLAKGSFYVQVASYADPVNAKKLVDSYGGKYPIVVEKGNDAKLKVCVGPVRKDEYGAIIERFRSLGYKDAFVRRGQ